MAWGRPGLAKDLFGIDLRSLALFRLSLAAVLCWDLLDRLRGIEAHYTGDGLVPARVLQELAARRVFSVHLWPDTLEFQVFLVAILLCAAVMLLVGWQTRMATVVAFLLLLSLHSRNPLLLHHADSLLRFLLMWSMFLPLGATLSIDARRASAPAVASPILSVGTAALLLQGFFVYLIATISKLQYDSWWEGRALYAVVNKASYARPLGEYVSHYPEVLEFFSHATLFVEGAIPLLLFSPWRRDLCRIGAVLLGIGLHAGIFAVVDVGVFQPVTVLALFPALPGSLWDRLGWALDPDRAVAWVPAKLAEALVAFLLFYTVASNGLALDAGARGMPEPLRSVGYAFRLDQRWRMFANTDITPQGWWVVIGELDDGTPIDLLHGTKGVSLARPHRYYREMPNMNWRTYWVNISRDHYKAFRPWMGRYFCRWWNEDAEPELRVRGVRVVYVQEQNYKPELGGKVTPRDLVMTNCSEAAVADR
ncbi:MAG: HTTM domain-containing protein [Myxococcota bacterium]